MCGIPNSNTSTEYHGWSGDVAKYDVTTTAPALYGPMAYRLFTDENFFWIAGANRFANEVLAINRNTNTFSLETEAAISQNATWIYIDGILGIPIFLQGSYLVVITRSNVVASIDGLQIRKILETKVIVFASSNENNLSQVQRLDEVQYLRMLDNVLTCGTLYFAYDYDLTHSLQRIADVQVHYERCSNPLALWKRADPRFFWNMAFTKPLREAKMDDWIIPVMSGFVCSSTTIVATKAIDLILISRRSCRRKGRRFTSRGLDREGNASNFVETEQIILCVDPKDERIFQVRSFVQTRGSIPLFWKQEVNLKYTPPTKMAAKDEKKAEDVAFRKHFEEQSTLYGPQVLVNLVNQTGTEGKMETAYKDKVEDCQMQNVHYVAFDFHKECAKMRYDKLSNLLRTCNVYAKTFGYFAARIFSHARKDGDDSKPTGLAMRPMQVLGVQKGTYRTNCMDCLDRTNVVQSVFAKQSLLQQLREVGVMKTEEYILDDDISVDLGPAFTGLFNGVWADNADAMSHMYTGTGAQKTDYTRTGKRTIMGALEDLRKSVVRYILNNFYDGFNHDSYLLFCGNFEPSTKRPSPFLKQEKSIKVAIIGTGLWLFLFLIILTKYVLPVAWCPGPYLRVLLFTVLLPVCFVLHTTYVSAGRNFCNVPRLDFNE